MVIDLYSDTQTRPTPGMRRAMAEAEVGDEQHGDDPSVNRLCERIAAMMGKEAALLLPSGTMCNNIAVLAQCRPGDEIVADALAHIVNVEGGAPAALAGVSTRTVAGDNGVFTVEQLEAAVRPPKRAAPRSRMVVIEQTSNHGMGRVWPLEAVAAIGAAAVHHGLVAHMDGARLLNACVASGVGAQAFAQHVDTVWLDLSKGLGCPIGGVLAGSAAFIEEAWRWKQRLGGAMRQAGVIAAAGLYALDHHVERLADDHAAARAFADGIRPAPGVRLARDAVDSNIVIFDVAGTKLDAEAFVAGLAKRGVRVGAVSATRLRAVTHLDVTPAQVEAAVRAVCDIAAQQGR